MRTTITLDEDVARAVAEARRERGIGVSEAVNVLARRGLAQPEPEVRPFTQTVSALGRPRLPLDDIEETVAILEGDTHR